MTAPFGSPCELHAGALRLAVRPDLGGCIAGLWHNGTPLMLSAEPGAMQASRPSASYPLVPYSNRIGHRRFRWNGQEYTTAPNFGDNPHSLHGVAWLRSWELRSVSNTALVLHYQHEPDEHWPFAFDVEQRFSLTPTQLTVQLAITSAAPVSQPVGLGWHAYFPKRARSHLRANVTHRWESDATQLPTHKVSQPGIDGSVAELDFDHCFDNWHGPAHIRDEAFSLQLNSSLHHLVVYTPRDKSYFCVEPVSHVSNAIQMANPAQHGLITLLPGETVEAWMTLGLSAQ
jgi:aldose 1-epimerase